jgi:hypothetical protein
MDIEAAQKRMKENPGLKMTMPQHYRYFQYNYFDEKSQKFLTETGEVWDIQLSKYYNEYDGYEDFKETK